MSEASQSKYEPLTGAERARRFLRLKALRESGDETTGFDMICICRVNEGTPKKCAQRLIKPAPLTKTQRNKRWMEKKKAALNNSLATNSFDSSVDMESESSDKVIAMDSMSNDEDTTVIEYFEQDLDKFFAIRTLVISAHFKDKFLSNEFGHSCGVCDRIWFRRDLKSMQPKYLPLIEPVFGDEARNFLLCMSCIRSLNRNRIPPLSTSNGFKYPDKPVGLPELDPISTRLISPRIMFMTLRRLVRDGSLGIIGQVINIPIDVNSMVNSLPRQLDDDYAINVAIKRKLFHKTSYLKGFVKKRIIKVWLEYLVQQPLYRLFDIQIDWKSLENDAENSQETSPSSQDTLLIEDLEQEEQDNATTPLLARQQSLMWNEENCVAIAPGRDNKPKNILYDPFAEELAFPSIYYGVGREFAPNVNVTQYMIANSEVRRRDRRGATPEHILFMAMKIIRMRMVDSIQSTFRRIKQTENITRRQLESKQFIEQCVEKDFAFLKTVPNSSQYWRSRKHDLFAMIRQLGKPTAFLTLSANEINWPHLLTTLHKLSDNFKDITVNDPMLDLTHSMRAQLVSDDPTTCCAYFRKMIYTFMNMLMRKSNYHNPFGKYRVNDFFIRFEFQHRGSPHAHILLWLENDPNEPVSEHMPRTIRFVTELMSVSRNHVSESIYANQVHKHTFTCTKRGESSCRFNIPYWPISETKVLFPLAKDDPKGAGLRKVAKMVKKSLEEKNYESIETFLIDNHLTKVEYLDIIRSTLNRPTLMFKRDPVEIMVNTFNPSIATCLNANMDLQAIIDDYSCANYVAGYINKSNRGLSNLHRELIKLTDDNPHLSQHKLLRKLGTKILNSVEMSAQEAAWYLLRQNMSHASREIIYIPTGWPEERQKSFKTKIELSKVRLDSTDVWTKNIIQKYEERPTNLEDYCLADFVASCNFYKRIPKGESSPENNETHIYSKRRAKRIIRYRNYDLGDIDNFKREMVTLFVPFRNELTDVLDRNRFITIYAIKIDMITEKRREYEVVSNIEQLINELQMAYNNDSNNQDGISSSSQRYVSTRFKRDASLTDFDEERITNEGLAHAISTITRRTNVMSKDDYCRQMRTTNKRQRELILEIINRLTLPDQEPLQIFLTGPAGCGKTYVLKLIMETYNRFSRETNELNNSYIACASTGKAAVNLGGTTVHSAFHLNHTRRAASIAQETLQRFKSLFRNVGCVIIDEISMIGNQLFHQINERLQQITGYFDKPFGAMPIIFCGDFRQLPPVLSTPVYRRGNTNLCGNMLWQMLDFYPLVQVMRQSNIEFSTILTKIGDGLPLTNQESAIIESRFRTEQWCEENLVGTIRLFHQNHHVDAYNSRVLQGGFVKLANDIISGYSTRDQLFVARTKLYKLSTVEASGLNYSVPLKIGQPYMITTNIDILDGLVNGTIGTLMYYDDHEMRACDEDQDASSIFTVWMQFENDPKIGRIARSQFFDANIRASNSNSGLNINAKWTPIFQRSVSINLGGSIRCRRTQLPLVPACAITIHKSQGGTFKNVVLAYDKRQTNQLVYVGMSRVESLDGLFLINSKNDHIFHHKRGSSAPTIKHIRDEYARLAQNQLKTLTSQAEDFMSMQPGQSIIISTINTQSLLAHSGDISSDEILNKSHILALTETWMANEAPVVLENFELVCCSNHCEQAGVFSSITGCNTTTSRRVAGGVALYKNSNRSDGFRFEQIDTRLLQSAGVGNINVCQVKINSLKFIICLLYIHPALSKTLVTTYLRRTIGSRLVNTKENARAIVTGDFNCNIADNNWLIELMANEFNLQYVETSAPTTLGCTTIDLTFTRNIEASCMSFVSYFSYHRPLLNRLFIGDRDFSTSSFLLDV